MSSYLSNLAMTVVHPGIGVTPRLPGRFEALHPLMTIPLDIETTDDAEPVSPMLADHDGATRSAAPPVRMARPGDPPMIPTLSPPPVIEPERPIRPSQPMPFDAARTQVEPKAPPIPESVVPTAQPTAEPLSVDMGKPRAESDRVKPVSPVSTPDAEPSARDARALPPLREPEPVSSPSADLQPVRIQPSTSAPTVAVQISPAVAPEPFVPVQTAAPDSPPMAQRSTPNIELPVASPPQTGAVTPLAGMEPADSTATQPSTVKPILEPTDTRPTPERHRISSLASRASHRLAEEPAPTIQVTIDRIEIRAVLPAVTPPPQPMPRRPVLPLDQYLRQRNEGKR